MRRVAFLVFLLMVCNLALQAQGVHAYTAIIKTRSGTEKGILNQVTADGLVIDNGSAIVLVKAVDIKNVRIKASKKPYKYQTYAKYDPWNAVEYEQVNHADVKVRKWGKEDPTVKEEVAGHVNTALVNGAANLIAAPLSSINSSILKVKIDYNLDKYKECKDELYYHSIYYQTHPDYAGELKKINAIRNGLNDKSLNGAAVSKQNQ